MNERIQQMIYNLNEKVGVHWTNEDKLEFAELIVRECANIASKFDEPKMSGTGLMIGHMIEQHFGVEE